MIGKHHAVLNGEVGDQVEKFEMGTAETEGQPKEKTEEAEDPSAAGQDQVVEIFERAFVLFVFFFSFRARDPFNCCNV